MCVCVCVCVRACMCVYQKNSLYYIMCVCFDMTMIASYFLSRSLKCYSCYNKGTDTDDLHLIELTLHKDPLSFPL